MTKSQLPLVSVIVRSMDRTSLKLTLESIVKQSYPAIEIIVVNAKGGEHSDVLAYCGRIALNMINQGGQPLSRSRAANMGLDGVSGRYFSFLDDDDTVDFDHFSRLVELQGQHGEKTIVYAGVRLVDSQSPDVVLSEFADVNEEGKLLAGNFIPIHAPLVPAILLDTGARFDESLDVYEDWDFWLQLESHTDFIFSGGVSASYFLNGTSGVNPHTVDEETMRQATLSLYRKWLPRLSAENLWSVCRLYHKRNLALHHTSQHRDALHSQLAALHSELQKEKLEIQSVKRELEEADKSVEVANKKIEGAINKLTTVQAELDAVYRSRSWALTAPLRSSVRSLNDLRATLHERRVAAANFLSSRLKGYAHLARFVVQATQHNGGVLRVVRKANAIIRVEGVRGVLRRLPLNRLGVVEAADFRNNLFHVAELVDEDCQSLAVAGSIAVMAHVYYEDLFSQIADSLNNIPWQYSLYVSVTSKEARDVVLERIREMPRISQFDVRVVPNRGRDIAPMLVEFREELLRHQYILHVHTKKSIYSGRERQEWRNYLINGLLGSERRIRHVFNVFLKNSSVGIVYPDTFEGVPYWAHSWLKNRGIALSLASRLGVDINHRSYVDAPMGSMFWARVDALKPLFDLKLRYVDFPEEQGQTDGTLQHAIERFFVLAANREGYVQRVILNAENGATLFISPGRKNIEHYFGAMPPRRIFAASASAQIVSFDIFDTLLFRPWFSPSNLFCFLNDVIFQKYGMENFSDLRMESERLARLKIKAGDVGIDDIYSVFGQLCGSEKKAGEIRLLEESAERRLLFPRPDICEAAAQLKASGKRVVLVSDMYLDVNFLREILLARKLDFFDSLYVSSDIGLRKDRGDIWPEVLRREGVEAEHWLHVGDNEHSDVQIPLDSGFAHPVHVMRSADLFFLFNEDAAGWIRPQVWQEGLYLGLLANRCFIPGLSVEEIVPDVMRRTVEINDLKDFGYLVFGPALASFMAWLLRQSREDRVTQLLYASREGYLLKQAHDLIASYFSVPEGEYFLCSRRAAIFSSIGSEASFDGFLRAHFTGSFSDFLRLRLGVEDIAPYRERLGEARLDAPGELPEKTEAYRRMLRSCSDLLEKSATVERECFESYARDIVGENRSALVDIGYSGTIQRALHGFLDFLAGGYYCVTVEQSADIEAGGHFAKGCFGHHVNAFHSDIPFYQFSLLSEAILTAPHGQLVRFENRDGSIVPVFKEPGVAQQNFSDIEKIHEGALDFLRDVLDVTGEYFESLAGHNFTANLAIRQVMEYRWKLGLDTPALHVEDNYSGNGEVSIFDFYDRKRKRLPGVLLSS